MQTHNFERKVYLPGAKFSELLTVIDEPDGPYNDVYVNGMQIGTYCRISPTYEMKDKMPWHQKLYVAPTQKLIDFVRDVMIHIDYDVLSFEIIVFQDEAHIYIRHGQIIGSFLLTIVPLADLPSQIKTSGGDE